MIDRLRPLMSRFYTRKTKKLSLILTAAPLLTVCCCVSSASAFHNGGVAHCDGCHTIHNSHNGVPMVTTQGSWLLKGADPGSICLNCHAGPGSAMQPNVASADGSALTPGGDFYWLTKTFTWSTGTSPGYSHGHNIVSLDYGFVADSANLQAPGGTYPAADLTCTSCHDPHGRGRGAGSGNTQPISGSGSYGGSPSPSTQFGTYRLLGGIGYDGGSQVQGYSFANPAPIAVQNASAPYGESDTSHVAYGSGMSEWCINCHSSYLTGNHSSQFTHPSGNGITLTSLMISTYNTYVKTGDLSGTTTTAYLQFVPFEQGETDTTLLTPTSSQGPGSKSNVMCLTCHRAHASAFRAIGRWDFDAALLIDSHPAAIDAGVSGNDVLNSYYGRNIGTEFGSGQKQFCEKCHGTTIP